MNLKTLIGLKKKEVPASNETVLVDAVRLWEVRWKGRNGQGHYDTYPELEAFVTREAAEAFATSLRNAFALIRHTSGIAVTVHKAGP